MADSVVWQIVWVISGIVIIASALLVGRNRRALFLGRVGLGGVFIVSGALFNTLNLLTEGRDSYDGFADASYIPFVRDTWQSLVEPNVYFFIPLLITFELTVGVLALLGGRKTQLALVAAIGFHVALMSFGWGFYFWSIPMIACFSVLLRGERKEAAPTIARAEHVEIPLAA